MSIKISESLRDTISQAESKLDRIRCPYESSSVTIFLHYLKVLDLTKSIQNIPATGVSKSVFALIVRTTIETWARLVYGIGAPERIIDLELESLESEIALHRVFDITFDSTGHPFDLSTYLRNQTTKLNELKAKGAKKRHISEIFESIKGLEIHRSVYKHLCQATHSSIISLIGDYFRVDPKTDDPYFAISDRLESKDLFPYYHSQCIALCHGSQIVHEFFKTGEEKNFQNLMETVKELQS